MNLTSSFTKFLSCIFAFARSKPQPQALMKTFAQLTLCLALPGQHHADSAIDGVAPTRETIGNGSYPLRAPVVALHLADLPARQLVAWLVSDEGQAWIEEIGFPRAGTVTE